jgi:hypothetical protein
MEFSVRERLILRPPEPNKDIRKRQHQQIAADEPCKGFKPQEGVLLGSLVVGGIQKEFLPEAARIWLLSYNRFEKHDSALVALSGFEPTSSCSSPLPRFPRALMNHVDANVRHRRRSRRKGAESSGYDEDFAPAPLGLERVVSSFLRREPPGFYGVLCFILILLGTAVSAGVYAYRVHRETIFAR